MSANEELNSIKKKYGESFMHVCRELFPTMLEDDGVLSSILADYFATNNRELGETIRKHHLESKFKEFVYSKVNNDHERVDQQEPTEKDPYELLSEAGYQLYECHNEEEIQSFRKYYDPNEELCTFHQGDRLSRAFVFFAVRKDAMELDRKKFLRPQREDKYSTSVLGIQFSKELRSSVSIKSRYNHVVENPDATYGNDLDKIVPGLTESFSKLIAERGLYYTDANVEKLQIPGYVVAVDKRYYKYNLETGGIYFCPGNVIIDGSQFHIYGRDNAIVMDNYILDLHQKKFKNRDDEPSWYIGLRDSFTDSFEKEELIKDKDGNRDVKTTSKIAKIEVSKNFQRKSNRTVKIWLKGKEKDDPIVIELNKDNQIVGYSNKYITRIGNHFMGENTTLEWIDLPNVTSIGNKFLAKNNTLKSISLPKVKNIGTDFLAGNEVLEDIYAPELRSVENNFLQYNKGLTTITFKNLEIIGEQFLMNNRELRSAEIPRVVRIGKYAFAHNRMMSEISCPRVQEIGSGFMELNELMNRIYMPELKKVGSSFCYSNTQMEEINFPNLIKISSHFFANNEIAKVIRLPKAKVLGECFMQNNLYAEKIDLPEVTNIRNLFMSTNVIATEVNMPKVENIDDGFMLSNTEMKIVNMQSVKKIMGKFLPEAKAIEVMNMPKLKNASLDVKRRVTTTKKKEFMTVINTIPLMLSKISAKDLAELDKESKISSTEVRMSRNVFKKLIDMCKSKTR